MRIALVADLHGNLPATEAVDADLATRRVDAVWCLGDMIGKGPSSPDTMDWAFRRCSVILQGNWDMGISAEQFPNDSFYYRQLGKKRMRMLRELPLEHRVTLGGQRVRLLHGRPMMDKLLAPHADSALLAPLFAADGEAFDTVGYADTHAQGLRTASFGTLFNTGSVGNAIGQVGAHYVLLTCGEGGAALDIRFIRVAYDRARAVRDALAQPALPNVQLYIREIETGIYSR